MNRRRYDKPFRCSPTLCVVVILLTSLLAIWLWIGWKLYFPPTVLELHRITVTNPDKTVKVGTNMVYDAEITRKKLGGCTIKRQLVNGYKITYEAIYPPGKPLGWQIVENNVIHVPLMADPGWWEMHWEAECPTGFLGQTVFTSGRSDMFMVVR